ncbi:MAG: TraR/DksA C4-type zinc finger protein, partial [Acidobacteriota bacterium]
MALLTADQLKSLWQRLTAAQTQIEALLTQTSDDVRPVDLELPIGRLTRIDAIQMQGMAQMNRHQLEIRRRQVDAALDCFAKGTYGLCRKCREPVGFERLDVLPESPFCLA